jgi:hypothetical protein
MTDKKYEVLIDKEVVATRMDIQTSTILVRALFEEYYNLYPLTISVREMERCEAVKCNDNT